MINDNDDNVMVSNKYNVDNVEINHL
jgi:hypothetical protein